MAEQLLFELFDEPYVDEKRGIFADSVKKKANGRNENETEAPLVREIGQETGSRVPARPESSND